MSISIGSIGTCLDDSGVTVRLYIVDTIYAGSDLDLYSLDDDFLGGILKDDAKPRKVQSVDFWCLV